DKVGPVLFAFTPIVDPSGIWTNDDLFRKLGLKIPRTFPQLLGLCRQAHAAGTVAYMTSSFVPVRQLALTTVYDKDKSWAGKLRAGAVTFAGTPGWRQALQHLLDMNGAGCFPPGVTGMSIDAARAQFVQGQSLMLSANAADKGVIDAADPQFAHTYHPWPSAAEPGQTTTVVRLLSTLGV